MVKHDSLADLTSQWLNDFADDSPDYGYLNDEELSILGKLAGHRRPLPVCHITYWSCQRCRFESVDLTTMAAHIMRAHRAAPVTQEELEERDSNCLAADP